MEERPPRCSRQVKSRLARRRHRPRRKKKGSTGTTGHTEEKSKQQEKSLRAPRSPKRSAPSPKLKVPEPNSELPADLSSKSSVPSVTSVVKPTKRPMPAAIYPMLAESITEPFDSPDWLFEIKWDGYRAVAFLQNAKVRLVSRNQNELTARYPELKDMAGFVKAKNAILDGEVVAIDEHGKPSFSLMQQRTGFRPGGKRGPTNADVPVLYYAFDLIYADGEDWRKVPLEDRKRKLLSLITPGDSLRFSDHYEEHGKALFDMVKQKGLEGIVAKRRASCYEERRSREWLKIKIRHTIECVVGGFTE
ncbi:MAG: hypothetical protein DMG99_21245, partial [Acidobacteria bacterium]